MTMTATPHLNFRHQAREALTFYQQVVGGDLTVVTYADMARMGPVASDVAEDEMDQVIFGQLHGPGGFTVMAFDMPAARPLDRGENAFFVSVRTSTEQEVRGLFDGLSDGAAVRTPLGPSPFSPLYGMLTDRFGITWVIDLQTERAG